MTIALHFLLVYVVHFACALPFGLAGHYCFDKRRPVATSVLWALWGWVLLWR